VRVLVAIPTYVEAENIEEVLRRARAASADIDLLVIDDNSPDGTADIAERVGKEIGNVEVLRRPAKKGLGNAYRAGFGIGIDRGYDLICQMDADLSHDPAVLPQLIAAVEAGADLAIGSRYVPGGDIPHWPAYRRALSRYGNLYAGVMLGTGIRDNTAGFRCYRASTLQGIEFAKTRANGYLFQIELAYRAWLWGGRTTEVPIIFTDRVRGYSKMSLSVMIEEMIMVTWWGIRDRVIPSRRELRKRAKTLAAASRP
jgi:dolichol-phosphate mannosyltransferase